VFKWHPANKRPPELVAMFSEFSRRGAKLEGIALAVEELWLAYDGAKPAVIRKPKPPIREID
jgi:hypothetical protein